MGEDEKRDEEHKLRDASRRKQGRKGNTETASAPGPAMLIAGAGANKPEAAGPDAAAAATAAAAAKKRAAAAAAEKKRLEWCRREYVDAKDCDKWVANELGQGLKKADHERDREDAERDREDELRYAERDREDKERDEEERKHDASAPGPVMLFAGAGANTPGAAGHDAAAAAAAAAAAKKRAAAAAAQKKRLEWCRREYVDAKDCDKWVANEVGKKREDVERDREDKLRDTEHDREDKRRDEEHKMRDAEHNQEDEKRDEEHKLRDASRRKQGREGNTETASAPGPAMLIAGAGANKPEAAGPD